MVSAVVAMFLLTLGVVCCQDVMTSAAQKDGDRDAEAERGGMMGKTEADLSGYPDEYALFNEEGNGANPAWTILNKRTLRMLNPTSVTFGNKLRSTLRENKEAAAAPPLQPASSRSTKAFVPLSRSHMQKWIDFNRIPMI